MPIAQADAGPELDPSLVKQTWTFHIEIEDDHDRGVVVATCVELPEVSATGETEDEAMAALSDRLVEELLRRWPGAA
jgi:hypothetical protein